MKRAAIYMRVSTARQEEEQTVENQHIELKERIKKDGNLLLPDCVYKDEGWSGSILERPDLDRMRADAHDNKFEILYSYDRGRVSRKFVHQEIILDDLKACKIEYVSLHDINGSTPEEALMGSVMGIFHEYEKLKITERMRIGKIRKVREAGKLLGYNPKYGYDFHPRVKAGALATDSHFTINRQQAAAVRQIFEWIADGHTKYQVRGLLLEHGIAPPKAMRTMWSGGTLDRLLRDTTYYGDHYYNKSESVVTKTLQNPDIKYRKVIKGSRRVRSKDEWMLVRVPAIIDKALFDKVQRQLDINKQLNPRNNTKNNYLLAGLVRCTCGKARTGDPGGNGNTYYRCTDRLSKMPLPRECYEKAINSKRFDDIVWRKLAEYISSPDLIKQQAERWLSATSPHNTQLTDLRARLSLLDGEERRYTKAYGLGLMSERLYKEEAKDIMQKRQELETEISKLSRESSAPKLTLEQVIAGTKKTLQNLDLTDKKFIITKIVDKVVATHKEATIWGHIPLTIATEVGYEPIHRHRRPPQRRQIHPV